MYPISTESFADPHAFSQSRFFQSTRGDPPVSSLRRENTASEIPEDLAITSQVIQRRYLIGGELREWTGPLDEVLSPIEINDQFGPHEVRLGAYPSLTAKEAREALSAAVNAYDRWLGVWPTMNAEQRIACVEKFLERMERNRDQVVKLMMWEIAKSYGDCCKEFDRTIKYVRDSIEAVRVLDAVSRDTIIDEGFSAQVSRSSLGVVLCMGPFNYPLNETFTTMMPALLMGNTVVFKTPKIGVLLFEPLLEAFKEAFPPGVVNTVYGDGKQIISPIISSGDVDVLAFIGSSQVADILTKQHPAPHRLHSVLGLGAKNPGIILPDADLDQVAMECTNGALSYNGQRCTALKILFVHRSIADEFVEKLKGAVLNLKIGAPWEIGVQITPLAERGKDAFLRSLIEDATAHGARVINDGGGEIERGVFKPAIVYPVSAEARLYHEEQFGPVIPVVPFDDVEEILEWQANSPFGQQVSIFGRNELIDPLVRGYLPLGCRININTQCQRGPDTFPFAARKSSGRGTLSIADALREFSVENIVAMRTTK